MYPAAVPAHFYFCFIFARHSVLVDEGNVNTFFLIFFFFLKMNLKLEHVEMFTCLIKFCMHPVVNIAMGGGIKTKKQDLKNFVLTAVLEGLEQQHKVLKNEG